MAYLLADNHLESAIVRNFEELISNTAYLEHPGTQVFVYIDRHFGKKKRNGHSGEPVQTVYTRDGTAVSQEWTGAVRYKLNKAAPGGPRFEIQKAYTEVNSASAERVEEFVTVLGKGHVYGAQFTV